MTQELLGRVYRELLDVLKSINQDEIHHDGDDFHELLSDVKEALAQTQEPVQARTVHITWNADGIRTVNGVPDYTHPPQRTWVGLTDEEITELHHEIKVRLMGTYKTEDIYRAIEAKLKEKNT
jgi:hypothetical protein